MALVAFEDAEWRILWGRDSEICWVRFCKIRQLGPTFNNQMAQGCCPSVIYHHENFCSNQNYARRRIDRTWNIWLGSAITLTRVLDVINPPVK